MPALMESQPQPLGDLLRYWRRQRSKSQLELSLDTGVSQRHISFVESGRSVPSRTLLLGLSRSLDIPLREQNALLLAAGFAPVHVESSWDSTEMTLVRRAVDQVLKQHEPHPALVFDRYWNILRTNEAATLFFGQFVDLSRFPKPRNLLHLIFDPEGLRPAIEDWDTVAAGFLQRVAREAVGHVEDVRTRALIESLNRYSGVESLTERRQTQMPVLPITFVKDGIHQRFFSMVTTIGLPQDVTAQEFRIECMYPIQEE